MKPPKDDDDYEAEADVDYVDNMELKKKEAEFEKMERQRDSVLNIKLACMKATKDPYDRLKNIFLNARYPELAKAA